MFKIILKNLWNRRKSNAWLFIELILVTILTWVIIDPAIVGLADMKLPLGYDADRIVNLEVATLPKNSPLYHEEYDDSTANAAAYRSVLAKAALLPDVEASTLVNSFINDHSTSLQHHSSGNLAVDTAVADTYCMYLPYGSKPFSTYGITAANGSPDIAELENRNIGENEIIITEAVDRAYWPDRRGTANKYFISENKVGDTLRTKVVGIVSDVRFHSFVRTGAIGFTYGNVGFPVRYMSIVLRLRDGIDASEYVRQNIKTINKQLRQGNFYVRAVTSQKDLITDVEDDYGLNAERKMQFALAALFLLNLILGVTGSIWLQTGKRVEEMGVLRSFGARRSQIVRMLIGESIALATVAFIIGELLYLQYALKDGLAFGMGNNAAFIPLETWVTNFGQHFALISAVVYAVIIICVCIGTYFPARKVSRIEPVDALRDE